MDKNVVIQIFGRKVKLVSDNSRTCNGCVLKDVCYNCDGDICICDTADGSGQIFVSAD